MLRIRNTRGWAGGLESLTMPIFVSVSIARIQKRLCMA